MNKKSLKSANTYLQDTKTARKMRIRSVASSTAIETQQPIKQIEERLIHPTHPSRHRVKLA